MLKSQNEKSAKEQIIDPQDEPRWKLVERVVALLEKSLTPDAEVRHNVELPDITTGHMRQCDVVIQYGKPPRQTMAIVEVQDRKSKVEIGDLQGWWEKMLGVGAQHLICVSALDYPQSVKDEVAKKRGPAVKLLRLRQVEQGGWPFGIAGGHLTVTIPRTTIKKLEIALNGKSVFGPHIECKDTDAVFWQEGARIPLSALALVNECIDQNQSLSMFPAGKHEATCSLKPGRRMWLEVDGQRQDVLRLKIDLEIDARATNIPITLSAYEQVNYKGALAWVATAGGKIEDREIQVRFIFIPQVDGTFSIAQNELITDKERAEGWFTFTPLRPASFSGA